MLRSFKMITKDVLFWILSLQEFFVINIELVFQLFLYSVFLIFLFFSDSFLHLQVTKKVNVL